VVEPVKFYSITGAMAIKDLVINPAESAAAKID
jgi:hypothetical protein